MCHSFLDYPTYQRLQQPKFLWRCGVCGRQSATPIDCCNRPDFMPQRHPGSLRLVGRKLVEVGAFLRTSLRAWRYRRPRPALGRVTVPMHDMPACEVPVPDVEEEEVLVDLVGAGQERN